MLYIYTDYRQDALQEHNKFRNIHEAPAMTLNNDMNTGAEDWARELFEEGKFEHSNSEHGENLYYGCSSGEEGASVQKAVTAWYLEN